MLSLRVTILLSSLCFFCSVAAAQISCPNPRNLTDEGRIVGGRLANAADWPGQAAFRLTDDKTVSYICGGTLIAPDVVLTAAHCIALYGIEKRNKDWRDARGRRAEVVISGDDLQRLTDQDIHQIEDIIVHPEYQSVDRGNDIAILRLRKKSNRWIADISLDRRADPAAAGTIMTMVAGFGVQSEGDGAREFKAADGSSFYAGTERLWETTVPLVDRASCQVAYQGSAITDAQICAGYIAGGKDSCQGDSGGPLVALGRDGCPYQVGVVSWGAGCARSNTYGIYTRVSAYADWIRKNVPEAKGVSLERVNAPTGPRSDDIETLFRQLRNELPNSDNKAAISMVGGAKPRLGDLVRFKITSEVAGHVIVIDLNARGEVSQIFPNRLSGRKRIAADEQFYVPDNQQYRLPIREPKGRGKIIVLVVPDHFNMKALETLQERAVGVEAVLPFFQNLIELIHIARASKTVSIETVTTESTNETPNRNWALGHFDYEVVD